MFPTHSYAYFDVLDPRRTAFAREDQAVESIRFGHAELTLALLLGMTPVFPQTVGWDSVALLGFSEGTDEARFFRELVRRGYIQIRMRNAATLVDAAIGDFESSYVHLYFAWPELSGDNPVVARKAVVEALRTNRPSSELPEELRNRISQLKALSEAASKAPEAPPEIRRGTMLSTRIERAAQAAEGQFPEVAKVLKEVLTLKEPNFRRNIDTCLNAIENRGETVPIAARSVVDSIFNRVLAECAGANMIGLTAPIDEPKTVSLLCRLFGATRCDVFQSDWEFDRTTVGDLAEVSWGKVLDFKEHPPTEEEGPVVANLVARVATEDGGRFAVLPKALNAVFYAASGTLAAAMASPGGQPWVSAGSAILGGIAGYHKRGPGDLVGSWLQLRLERKYLGLIDRVRSA